MKRGDLVEVDILDVTSAGEGLARVEGQVFFVPFTAVGDRVRAEVVEMHKSYGRGIIREIFQAGPQRETPPCAYFGKCGGCQYQHLTYTEELRLKEKQVREAFARIAKLPAAEVRPILASPEAYGYRNRITVHAEGGHLGFRGVRPQEVVDISSCKIAHPEVNALLAELRGRRPAEGHYSLRHPDLPKSAFFQANHFLLETFRKLVVGTVDEDASVCVEAYCGGGFFTAGLAREGRKVVGIEQDGRSLRDAARLQLPSTVFFEGAVEEMLGEVLRDYADPTMSVLLDPPRTGLPGVVRQWLTHSEARQIVYVSCDPATLARDAADLKQRYQLEWVQPIDMFPRTAKIECVTAWQRI
jgi:23S rRNA (uracil1939-C5)-methyltransferase